MLKTHDVKRLFHTIPQELCVRINVGEDELDLLSSIYTESRYPGEIGLLPDGESSTEEALHVLNLS